MQERTVQEHIEVLVAEEHRLIGLEDAHEATDADRARLGAVRVELDRYWDLLRQRRAERRAGRDPDRASLRDADTVEHYEQ